MTRLIRAALFAAMLACAPSIMAQDTLRLTSEQVVEQALAGGPEALLARLRVARARAERLRAAPLLPAPLDIEFGGETDAPFEGAGEGGWELALSQEIEIGGRRGLRLRAADAAIAEAELDLRAVELELRLRARIAFASAVAAESRLRLADTLLAFTTRLDSAAARLLAVGEIAELDRNSLLIERARREAERSDALRQVDAARAELALLIGGPPPTFPLPPVSREGPSPAERAALLASVTQVERELAAGNEEVIAARPEWRGIARSMDRLALQRSLAGRGWVPSIRIGAGVRSERQIITGEDVQGSEQIRNGLERIDKSDRMLDLRLGLAIPLPFGGLHDAGEADIAVADAELEIARGEHARLAAAIRAEIARAAGRLRGAARVIDIYQSRIAPVVRRNLELLERGYLAGELSATQVVTQQEQLVGAERGLIDAHQEYAEAAAEFERAIGR